MPGVRGRIRGLVVAVGAGALAATGPALPAAPATPGTAAGRPAAAARPGPPPVESIPAYDVVLDIDRRGVLHVRETITYDFDRGGEHGIVRHVPYRRGDRLFEVRGIRTSSSTGAPARARTLRLLNTVRITVGGEGHRVTGRQAYVIQYEVDGLFTPRGRRTELVWDAIGRSWDVPIGEVAVRVRAPVPLRRVSCVAGGRAAGTRCLRDRDGPYAVGFTQRGLRPREGVLIRVRLPAGAVDAAPPRYARPRWDGTRAGTAVLGLAAATAVVVAARGRGGRPLPRRRAGRLLVAGGVLLVLADVADDVVPRGPWQFSLGDLTTAGVGVAALGAGLAAAHRARDGVRGPARDRAPGRAPGGAGDRIRDRPRDREPAPTTAREDYS